MKTADNIANESDRIANGHVFTDSDFMGEVINKEAVVNTLSRMVVFGKIVKLAKDKYFLCYYWLLQPEIFFRK